MFYFGFSLVLLMLVLTNLCFAVSEQLPPSEAFIEAYKRSNYEKLIKLQLPPEDVIKKVGNSDYITRKIAVSVRNIEYCVKPYFKFKDYNIVPCKEDKASEIIKKTGIYKEYTLIPPEEIADVAICNKTCMRAGNGKDFPVHIELLICSSTKTGKSFINRYIFYRADKISSSLIRDAICLLSKIKPYAVELYHFVGKHLSELANRL